jgi:hypothetical protein
MTAFTLMDSRLLDASRAAEPSAPPVPAITGATRAAVAWTRGPVARIVIVTVALRLATAVLAFFAQVTIPVYQDQGFGVYRQRHAFWDNFARYDSGWYYGIARNGYEWVEGGRNNLAFFPVYPMAMRASGLLLGGKQADFYFGGIAVSWVACMVAMLLLYRLACLDMDEDAAERAVPYALLYPFAFFFGVVYSESLFLMLVLGAFYGFRTRRWALGAGLGLLATATRVNGVMILPALAWVAWTHVREDRATWRPALAALAVVPMGLVAYSAFCYSLSGNPLEWMDSIRRWEYHPGGAPWAGLQALGHQLVTQPYHFLVYGRMAPYDTLNGLAAVLALLLVPAVWMRLGTAYALFMLANLLLPLSSGQYEGLGRYTSVFFPIAILAGAIQQPSFRLLVLGISAAFYTLCLVLFVNAHPIF